MSHRPAGSTGQWAHSGGIHSGGVQSGGIPFGGMLAVAAVLASAAMVAGCTSPPDPLQRLQRQLNIYPEYSVVLSDMETSGTFFKSYHHRYTIVRGHKADGAGNVNANSTDESVSNRDGAPESNVNENGVNENGSEGAGAETPNSAGDSPGDGLVFDTETTDWIDVSRQFFDKYEPMLGMVVLSRGEQGKVDTANYPPGYQYVGNQRYGSWRTDSNGGSFWEFYGKYALFSHLLGSSRRPLYRSDYDLYRNSRSAQRPYFGPANNYGTRGSYTKTSNPTFYQRQQVRQRSKSQKFSQKVKSRASSSRSRSGARGK